MTADSRGNLFRYTNPGAAGEAIETLLEGPGCRIERIVSWGHASPADFWYEQEQAEWVVVLQGRARLQFAEGEPLELAPGDFIEIAARRRHRVVWTQPDGPTLWLAVHVGPGPVE